jgi:hypothetical protein
MDLMSYTRLTRSIRQKCCVEQRNQRPGNLLWAAVGQESPDTAQDGGGICQLHPGEVIVTTMLQNEIDEHARKRDSLDATLVRGNILDGCFDDPCYVERDSICGLGVPKPVGIGGTWELWVTELFLEKLRNEEFVEPLRK